MLSPLRGSVPWLSRRISDFGLSQTIGHLPRDVPETGLMMASTRGTVGPLPAKGVEESISTTLAEENHTEGENKQAFLSSCRISQAGNPTFSLSASLHSTGQEFTRFRSLWIFRGITMKFNLPKYRTSLNSGFYCLLYPSDVFSSFIDLVPRFCIPSLHPFRTSVHQLSCLQEHVRRDRQVCNYYVGVFVLSQTYIMPDVNWYAPVSSQSESSALGPSLIYGTDPKDKS